MKFPKLYKGFSVSLTILAVASIIIFANVSHAQSPVETTPTPVLTRDNGAPVGDNQNSQVAGSSGPVLLQDTQLIEKLARFDRERIPERVVHARGTGAHGEFVSSADLSDITVASPFEKAGKKTPVFVRFSSVIHSKGSPETLRDPRGFATKFYTDTGNWDLVGNNLPIFFIRDAIKFPDMVHSLKPDTLSFGGKLTRESIISRLKKQNRCRQKILISILPTFMTALLKVIIPLGISIFKPSILANWTTLISIPLTQLRFGLPN